MFDLTNFDQDAKSIIRLAHEEAESLGAKNLGSEHIVLALLKYNSEVKQAFAQYGMTYRRFRQALYDLVGQGDYTKPEGYAQGARNILMFEAKKRAEYFALDDVSPEVLAICAISDKYDMTEMVIDTLGFDENAFIRSIVSEDDEDFSDDESIEEYTINLNDRYKAGKIDPVIGREEEIERMIQILSRRTKNNPTLIGEPGVGKTAIVYGLAERIEKGEVPYYLADKNVYMVDMTSLVAGTKYRGDFESRIKKLLERASKDKSMILFIDEIHNIVGAGGSEGSLDASNILKPYLARGDIQIIGATTFDEYKKYIEKDSALERRLQTIVVEEPSVEESIEILRGIKEDFERYHNVKITDEALIKSVTLSKRYLSERFLPDKAIDVMDEAMSKARTKVKVKDDMDILKENLLRIQDEKMKAIGDEDFIRAAKLRDEEKIIEARIGDSPRPVENTKNIVDTPMIETIVSRWSKVPVSDMTSTELEKLRSFKDNLKAKVIGQDPAIDVIDKAIKRSKAGLKNPNRPIASMLFVGPTGVGKTYLAKRVSYELFGDENAMTVIDMSEYMERHSVSKLIGSPPGYVGFEEGGQLTENVRRKPYQVILFDEIEKAHPDVFNALLQILEEGRLSDSKGKEVNFKNTVIIMTSNAGTSQLEKQNSIGFMEGASSAFESIKGKVNKALKDTFRPEFLNRIDEIVVFDRISKDNVKKIARLEIEDIKSRVSDKYKVDVSDAFVDHIAEVGYSDVFGVRPLKRALTTALEDNLSEKIIEGDVMEGDKILVDYEDGQVKIKRIKDEEKQSVQV